MNKISVRTIATGGVLSALVLLSTYILKVPTVLGYVNLGDATIFAAAAILGPFAAICAGLGSALADLIGGYGQYAMATFIIKGTMGLIAGYALTKYPKMHLPVVGLVFAGCEIVMVGGYFLFEIFLYGFTAALAAVPYNALQAVAGITLGLVSLPFIRRIRI
jgi:uncharacterized membrane protein